MANDALSAVFDTIVISAEAGTDDKAELCAIAVQHLGCDDPAQALLLDNIAANAEAWRARGGAAYWFRGDDRFRSDFLARGWNALAEAECPFRSRARRR